MSNDLENLSGQELALEAKRIGKTAEADRRGGGMASAAALTELSALVEELCRRLDKGED